jgi:hypothetical protein
MVALGLAAYVGLIYGLTVLPLQFEVPLPPWGILVVPPVVYGLLVLLVARRPSVVRWLVGTIVLSALHTLLGLAREPLSAFLDPALAGRPLPWLLPPPLPELVGVILLLVPLRDGLRARPRSARERMSGAGRLATGSRGRAVVVPRLQPAASAEGTGSLSETLLARSEPSSEPAVATAPLAPAPALVAPVPSAPPEEPRSRRAAARAERGRPVGATRRVRRSDVVLRIALDRIMGQLPPGTFLAPEDEVAASLRDPGHLLIPGELVVTQLSEGIARVAWSDIADQFPPHLVGLGAAEISEHLRDGLKLPLDEVVGQLPHELFVADTPEVEMPGLDRIPVPFHPLEGSGPAPSLLHEAPPAPAVKRTRVAPPPTVPAPAVPETPAPPPAPTPVVSPAVVPRVEQPVVPAAEPIRMPEPVPVVAAAAPGAGEATVRISFGRVASEIPAEVFRVPLEQVAQQMWQPGSLLIPHSLVLPQLAEGLIRVSWEAVASQFPREQLTASDAEMMERLPNGIRLPLDEVIRQVPPDLFMAGGPAVDVRGLESFPAPFQPLVSDPAPEPAQAPPAEAPAEAVEVDPDPAPAAIEVTAAASIAVPEVDAEATLARVDDLVEPEPAIAPSPDLNERPRFAGSDSEAVALGPEPADEPTTGAEPPRAGLPAVEPEPQITPLANLGPGRVAEPAPVRADRAWQEIATPAAPHAVPVVAGPAEMAEARRIAGLLAPIGSFDVSVQTLDGVTVFAMAAPTVAQETAAAVAGLALPLLTDRRAPWPVDQITLRGPETALVLTPLGGPTDRGPVLAAGAPRGGALALLEILCRRAAGDRDRRPAVPAIEALPPGRRSLVPAEVPAKAAGLTSALTAFGPVAASVLRDAEGEDVLYFFLPPAADASATGAFAQDLQAVMRKAAGSGAVFRTAVLRSGNTVLVIQNEEVGHGRSIVVVAGGDVTRPGLAYRQIERATATLVHA